MCAGKATTGKAPGRAEDDSDINAWLKLFLDLFRLCDQEHSLQKPSFETVEPIENSGTVMDKQARPAIPSKPRPQLSTRRAVTVTGAILSVLSLTYFQLRHGFTGSQGVIYSVVDNVQECAIHNLHKDLSFLDPAEPITTEEFIDRRDRLAQALALSNIDAFVLEPGYTFQYGDVVCV